MIYAWKETFCKSFCCLKFTRSSKKYFLVFEGHVTEYIYFQEVLNSRRKIKINNLLDIIVIERSKNEIGNSHPLKIIKKVLKIIELSKKEHETYETLIDKISDYYDDNNLFSKKGTNFKELNNILHNIIT